MTGLDAWLDQRRDDAQSVDTCARCDTPFGALARVTVDLAAFLGTDDHALLCDTCRADAVREMDADLTAGLDESEVSP